METEVVNQENKVVKKISLPKLISEAKPNRQLLFDCVQAYLTNQRQGTQKAKTRGEVQGSTAKIYRQKGTGRARHGDIKANIFVGGGIAFPPKPRDWQIRLPKKAKRRALAQALRERLKEGNLLVVDQIAVSEIKTKELAKQLAQWKITDGLILVEKQDEKLLKSIRNIPRVTLTTIDNVNALQVLAHHKVVFTELAFGQLEKRLSCD